MPALHLLCNGDPRLRARSRGAFLKDPKSRIWAGVVLALLFTVNGISLFHSHYMVTCRSCEDRVHFSASDGKFFGCVMLIQALAMLAFAWNGYRKLKSNGK
jgi:hypothetical protein